MSDVVKRTAQGGRAEVAGPAWPIAILAGTGAALAAYLTWTKLSGDHALFCTGGSSCDAVQTSRYSVFLGLPVALWGAVLNAAVGGLALIGFTPRRWLAAFLLAVVGVSFSSYLTYLEVAVISALCAYCLAEAIIWALLFAALLRWGAASSDRRAWPLGRILALGGVVAFVTVAVGVAGFRDVTRGAPTVEAELARHLTDSGAVMYGAYWCPHCRDQKALFSGSANLLPYVECDPKGAGARPELCDRAKIRVYPTWIIHGERYEGVRSLQELARLSGFPGVPPVTAR